MNVCLYYMYDLCASLKFRLRRKPKFGVINYGDSQYIFAQTILDSIENRQIIKD